MQLKNRSVLFFGVFCLLLCSCMLIPKEYRTFIEPKLISINRDLTFSYGADWDTLYAQSPDFRPLLPWIPIRSGNLS